MEYILFQMKLEVLKENPLAFLGSEYIKDFNKTIVKKNYDQVYSGTCAEGNSRIILEQLFEKFNIERPEDFKGRSMSVSDVVVFLKGNKFEYWFCDGMRFEKINGLKWLGLNESDTQNLNREKIYDLCIRKSRSNDWS